MSSEDSCPKIKIMEPSLKETKKPQRDILVAFLEIFFLAVTGFFAAVTLADNMLTSVRLGCGAITIFDLYICIWHFTKSYDDQKMQEYDLKNKEVWKKDYDNFQKLRGIEFELAPPIIDGNGRLRIFYQTYQGNADVWYSNGIYDYKAIQGESVIDFDKGLVRIPPFLDSTIMIQERG